MVAIKCPKCKRGVRVVPTNRQKGEAKIEIHSTPGDPLTKCERSGRIVMVRPK